MALLKSANFSGSIGSYIWIELYGDVISQDSGALTSTIKYTLKFRSGNASGGGTSASGYINNSVVGSISSFGANADITIGTKIETVQHSSDGTKTVNYSASLSTVWNNVGSASLSGSWTLPKLNRASSINSFGGEPSDISGNFDIEGNFTATYTNYVSSYKQKLRLSIPNVEMLVTIDNYVSGANATLTSGAISSVKEYMNTNHIKEVTLGAVIETWSGNTKIGESVELMNKASFKNAEPVVSIAKEETDTKTKTILGTTATKIVQNASKVKLTITPTAQKGATISSVSVSHSNATYTPTKSGNNYIVTIPIKSSTITITTTDNRGNVKVNTLTWSGSNYISYLAVDISPNFTIRRTSVTSSTIRFNLTATYYQTTIGSSTNAPHLYYKLGSNTRVEIPSSAYVIDNTNHKLTLTNYDVANLLPHTQSGQFVLQLEDLLTTDEEGGTNGYVLKGIPTFEAGEHDLQVNGDLVVADQVGENGRNVIDEIDNAINNNIKLRKYTKSVSLNSGMSSVTMGTVSVPTGYTYVGCIADTNGYGDQWVVSYSKYGSNIVAMVHSNYSGSLSSSLVCYAIYIKTSVYNGMLL